MAELEYTIAVRTCRHSRRLIATSPDLRGLVLEVDSLDELQTELLWVSERLLRSNHGLADAQIAEVQLNVTLQNDDELSASPPRPRILIDDQRAVQAVAA